MARYYTEDANGRVCEVMAQDETGIYRSFLRGPGIAINRYEGPARRLAKLPEWADAREIDTTSRDYLDFVRRFERNSYMETRPSEIAEMDGSADEVIREVWRGEESPAPRSR